MRRYIRRTDPGARENLQAGLVAGVLGGTLAAASFYLIRLFLSREVMEPLDSQRLEETSPGPAHGREEH